MRKRNWKRKRKKPKVNNDEIRINPNHKKINKANKPIFGTNVEICFVTKGKKYNFTYKLVVQDTPF